MDAKEDDGGVTASAAAPCDTRTRIALMTVVAVPVAVGATHSTAGLLIRYTHTKN